jgi:hypothetical protein
MRIVVVGASGNAGTSLLEALAGEDAVEGEHGEWLGRGLIFGREFCRFRLVRDSEWCGRLVVQTPRAASARPRPAAEAMPRSSISGV